MQLPELTAHALQLPHHDRLTLIATLTQSIQSAPQPQRAQAIQTLRGLLATSQPAPTDRDIQTLLDQRRIQKYSS